MKQFWRFLLAGGIAAIANCGARFVFSVWLAYEWAIVLAYLVGMAVGFVLMRGYVFDAHGKPLGPQVVKYGVVNLVALAQTLIVSIVLARWLLPAVGIVGSAEALGHFAGVLVPVATSYFGHRMATFK